MNESKQQEIVAKLSIVKVDRKSRGRFPGERAPVGTMGLVWTSWFGSGYGTHKISLITKDLKLYFTTASCVSVVGTADEVEGFDSVRSDWASEHFMPVVLTAVDMKISAPLEKGKNLRSIVERDKQYVRCHTLCKKTIFVKKVYCHPDDWQGLMSGLQKGERVFCLRLEPWILEKAGLI